MKPLAESAELGVPVGINKHTNILTTNKTDTQKIEVVVEQPRDSNGLQGEHYITCTT